IRWPRSSRAWVEQAAQRTASTRLLFPLPLGPTIAVMPRSRVTSARDANVLKPEMTSRRNLIRRILPSAWRSRQYLGASRSRGPKIWCSCFWRRGSRTTAAAAAASPPGALARGLRRRRWRWWLRRQTADQGLRSRAKRRQEPASRLGATGSDRTFGHDRAGPTVGGDLRHAASHTSRFGCRIARRLARGSGRGRGRTGLRGDQPLQGILGGGLLRGLLGSPAPRPGDLVTEQDFSGVLTFVTGAAAGDG